MSLSVVSASLNVITDAYVYFLAIRAINYIMKEYLRNAELQYQQSCGPAEKPSITKWKVLVSLIFLLTIGESILATLVRLSFSFSEMDDQMNFIILGGLMYG